ncbi:MAG: IS1634 family transposase [Bdellovibrionales bacterium]|nr:IS1634 family transposase [Bdellovibrionales bacterium]
MFIRKSTAKNKDGTQRVYFQLAESIRINGKPRNRVLCNLGRAGDEATQVKIQKMAESLIEASEKHKLFNLVDDLKAESSKEYGPFLVFSRLFKELRLKDIISESLSDIGAEFDVAEALFNLILNRLTEPVSKRQMTLWEQDVEGATEFDLHQYYRAMDYLIEHKEEIERKIFFNQASLFNQELDIVLFDTTSLVYYGEGADKYDKPEDQQLLDYGFSKARRSDLKQIVVGVLMSKEGIPLAHETFSGNTNDVKCFSQIIDQLKNKYSVSNIVLVGDRGMISKSNIKELESSKLKYILGYRMRTISKEERKDVLSQANLRKLKSLELQFKEVDYRGQRLIVCYNEKRAEKDQAFREREVEKLKEKLKGTKSIKQLISNPHHRKYLKINDEKSKATLDLKKVEEDALYDGVFVLTTNTRLSCLQVVERYKDLWQIEAGFRQLKSELQMGPIYHHKDKRIRAHVMICFMAFCIRVALYKKLKQYFKKESFSLTQLQRDLKALHAIELTVDKQKIKLRTELKEGANHIFRAIGMRPPNRVLHSEAGSVVKRL